MSKKWGSDWRTTNPWKHPFNNPTLTQSITTFDLEFIRKKHLG